MRQSGCGGRAGIAAGGGGGGSLRCCGIVVVVMAGEPVSLAGAQFGDGQAKAEAIVRRIILFR